MQFQKFLWSVKKEWLGMSRDLTGLALLFIMPIFLVVVVTLVQDGTFKLVEEKNISMLVVNPDKGPHAMTIIEGLQKSGIFNVQTQSSLEKDVQLPGNYKIAIVFSSDYSQQLEQKIICTNERINEDIGFSDIGPSLNKPSVSIPESPEIVIYFDAVLQPSYREMVSALIKQMVRSIESNQLMSALYEGNGLERVSDELLHSFDISESIVIKQNNQQKSIPSSTQHNVPAWSLFAMFFIVVSLGSNIMREKLQGSFVRLRTMPSGISWLLWGKTSMYLLVCFAQLFTIVLLGKYLFPLLGLPGLQLPVSISGFLWISFCSALAAIGFSIAVGITGKTLEQSNGFGAIMVIIMAAIGGVWVPTFVMPSIMQYISKLSPMNWGLEAYYDLFLRGKSFIEIFHIGINLICFALLCLAWSYLYMKKRSWV